MPLCLTYFIPIVDTLPISTYVSYFLLACLKKNVTSTFSNTLIPTSYLAFLRPPDLEDILARLTHFKFKKN